MNALRGLALVVCLVASTEAEARTPQPWEQCFVTAGQRFGINPLLLRAIAWQESGMRPDAVGHNDPSLPARFARDLGVMQINTQHLDRLGRHGISEQDLFDPCVNIHVGAWILADAVRRHGMTWKAVGVYHSPTPARQENYARLVQRHLLREINAINGTGTTAAAPAARTAIAQRAPAVASGVWEARLVDEPAAGGVEDEG